MQGQVWFIIKQRGYDKEQENNKRTGEVHNL